LDEFLCREEQSLTHIPCDLLSAIQGKWSEGGAIIRAHGSDLHNKLLDGRTIIDTVQYWDQRLFVGDGRWFIDASSVRESMKTGVLSWEGNVDYLEGHRCIWTRLGAGH